MTPFPFRVVAEKRARRANGDLCIDLDVRVAWWTPAGVAFWFECWSEACGRWDVPRWHPLALVALVTSFPGWPW